jgi:DNA-binding transcriptional MerR regulator
MNTHNNNDFIKDAFSSILNNQELSKEKLFEFFELIGEVYMSYSAEKFQTKDLGITRKELSCWYRDGLSPYKLDESGWKRYSLIDCIWWRFVAKLKRFGTSTKRIIEIRDLLFPRSKLDLGEVLNGLDEAQIAPSNQKDLIIDLKNNILDGDDIEVEDLINKTGLSFFGIHVLLISLLHQNIMFIETEDEELGAVDIGSIKNEEHFQKLKQMYIDLANKNHITINLSALVYDFFNTEQIRLDNDFFSSLMNKQERKIIDMIRSGQYKQVSVSIKDGSITHFRSTKNEKQLEDTINKMSRMIKKGEYKRIELLAIDGKIVKYDEEEMIKI